MYADSEKVEGNVMGQYQAMRDRQMKTASLHAEINRIRLELSAEVRASSGLSTNVDLYF